jgi:thiamine biosynthesis lipoprotein
LDRSKEILHDWEIEQALIHAGGSTILACGGSWNVGVGGLWAEGTPEGIFALEDRALSGSGTEVKGEHIIDPFSGEAPSHHLAAWAVHPSAAISDALSTTFMLLEDNKIEEICVLNPETIAFVVNQKEELKKIRYELDVG